MSTKELFAAKMRFKAVDISSPVDHILDTSAEYVALLERLLAESYAPCKGCKAPPFQAHHRTGYMVSCDTPYNCPEFREFPTEYPTHEAALAAWNAANRKEAP